MKPLACIGLFFSIALGIPAGIVTIYWVLKWPGRLVRRYWDWVDSYSDWGEGLQVLVAVIVPLSVMAGAVLTLLSCLGIVH